MRPPPAPLDKTPIPVELTPVHVDAIQGASRYLQAEALRALDGLGHYAASTAPTLQLWANVLRELAPWPDTAADLRKALVAAAANDPLEAEDERHAEWYDNERRIDP